MDVCRLVAIGFVVASVGCAPADGEGERQASALTVALRTPVFGPQVAGRLWWVKGAGDFALPTGVRLGAKAREGARLALPEGSVSIAPEDVDDVAATIEDGAITFTSVRPGEDLLYVGVAHGLEELRVLRSPGKVHSARYRLRFDRTHLDARIREGRVEVFASTGWVGVSSNQPFLVDGRGTRRALTVSVEGLADGARVTFTADLDGLEAPIVVDPVWSTLPDSLYPHDGARTLTFSDGKILVVGGGSGTGAQSLAEIFDPAINAWSSTTPMPDPAYPELLELPSGKVLALDTNGSAWDYAEIYDRTAKTWTKLTSQPTMQQAIGFWSAGLGKAVVFQATKTWRFSDGAFTFTAATGHPLALQAYSAAQLPDGKIVLVGGTAPGEKLSAATYLYDPVADAWTAKGDAPYIRRGGRLVPVSGGRVVHFGGQNGSYVPQKTVEILDVATGTWTLGPSAPFMLDTPAVVTLGSDRLLVAAFGNVAVFDAKAVRWAAVSPYAPARSVGALVGLSGGRAMVVGGVAAGVGTKTVSVLSPAASGTACSASHPGDCASTYCADAVCCDKACDGPCETCSATGSCTAVTGAPPRSVSACAPYASCAAGVCLGACSTDTDCVAGSWCSATKCVPKKAAAEACTAANQCSSGFCADGVCCDKACTGQCEACDVSGTGKCGPVTGKPRGTRAACPGDGSPCSKTCNGTNVATCDYLPKGSEPCGSNACSSGVETHASTCDGAGKCDDAPKSCGAYRCGGTSCRSACGSKLDCSDGNYCASGACVPIPGLGASCSDASACASGACVDGVCCATPSCGAGSTCAAPGKEGRCTHKNGLACATDDICASGMCVDGVCCDARCPGQCESCIVPGQLGTCTAVVGLPRGAKPACAKTADDACSQSLCDGKDRGKCGGFVGADVACRPATCKGGSAVAGASCTGTGACPAVAEASCGAYACDKAGVSCRLACTSDADCAPSYRCSTFVCKPKGDACDEAKAVAILATGERRACAPYRCEAGACLGRCATTDDCSPGYACEGAICVAVGGGSADGGGCSHPGRPVGGGGMAALFLLGGVVGLRRRLAGLALTASVGCSSKAQEVPAPPSADHTPTPSGAARRVLGTLTETSVGARLRAAPAALVAGGILTQPAPGSKGPWASPTRLRARVPTDPRRAFELRREDHAGWANVRFAEAPAGETFVLGPAAITPAAFAGLDLARVVDASSVEDLFVAHKAEPVELAYALDLHDLYARTSKGRIELVDVATGTVAFETEPAFAVDARGTRRDAAVALVGNLVTFRFDLSGLQPPIAIDPAWTASGDLTIYHPVGWMFPRPSGAVLFDYAFRTSVWTAATGTWKVVSGLAHDHNTGSALALSPSKILLMGGVFDNNKADVFDPEAETLTAQPSFSVGRNAGAVAWLSAPVSRVLLTGGLQAYVPVAVSELYDPIGKTWATTAPMPGVHLYAATASSGGGKALLIGGEDTSGVRNKTVHEFDGVTKTWSAKASMNFARSLADAFTLSSGKVLVVNGGVSIAELYDPTTDAWTTVGTAPASAKGAVTLLPGDRLLFAGGDGGIAAAAVWDPAAGAFFATSPMPSDRRDGHAVVVTGGAALVAGGATLSDGFAFSTLLFKQLANGAACGGPGDCASLRCVDGVCCDKICNGPCEACNVAGSVGTCSGVTGSPTKGHPACAPYKACVSGVCASSCTTDGDCCGTAAACCTDASCPGTFAGAYCNGSACVAKKAAGVACTADGQCLSGACADGVCCNVACAGQCEACDVAGKVGTCSPVSGTPHGTRSACDGAGGTCGARCNGTDRKACTFPPATTSCGADTCAAGVETHARKCDGIGHCGDVPKVCGAYGCGPTACRTSCAATSDCAAGFVCKGTACVPAPGLGEPCSASAPCSAPLSCTDGFCCGVTSCGSGKTCGAPSHRGECAKVDGQICAADGECGSGSCVDGVCCDSACAGQCQACDVPGNVGKCVSVKGAPHGARLPCSKAGTCDTASCDGSDASRCVALPGAETTCAAPSCAAGVALTATTCDGKGGCPPATKTPCAPYACATDGVACAKSCTSDDGCAAGFVCAAAACVKPVGRCSDDGSSVLDLDGKPSSCAPLRCRAGACLDTCATSEDCVPGAACASGRCEPTAVPTVDDGGGCTHGAARNGVSAWLAALTLGAIVARRRPRGRARPDSNGRPAA